MLHSAPRSKLTPCPQLKAALQRLREAASDGEVQPETKEWVDFLDRWGYGPNQRHAIVAVLDRLV